MVFFKLSELTNQYCYNMVIPAVESVFSVLLIFTHTREKTKQAF